ncbi:MAG TPA: hypothetical protein VNN18_06735 [Candidatus Xenobia bacterium]|nr:hypothetical protein [Candidatus Xenobia bacterium]
MPRNLSAAAKTYTGPIVWLAQITTGAGATYYFAEDNVLFSGNLYQPYLRLTQGPRLSRRLQADSGEIELLNADLAVSALLEAEAFEGALCELKQLLLGIDEAVLILRGRLTEQQETDTGVSFRLVSELDPGQIELHARAYAQLCTWRFAKPPCGYDPAAATLTEHLSEQSADIFSAVTIGLSTLNMTVDTHKGRVAVLTAGTGRGQKRCIRANTATTLVLHHPWATLPDATSKFAVYSFTAGAPKLLFRAASAVFTGQASAATARELTDSSLAMTPNEHRGDWLRILAGAGALQQRRIGANTATTLTIDATEPDFNPAPDTTSQFGVFYRTCPKDYAPSCEERARTEAFNGFPTLVPLVADSLAEGGPGTLPPGLDPGDVPGESPGLPL